MKWRLFLIAIVFVVGCEQPHSKITYEPSAKQKLANEIRKKVAFQLKAEKDLIPSGSGGQMMDEIKMLALSFDYYKPIDIDKGRKLLIEAVHEFVAAVNADERIRPYLGNYPFESRNIEIRIFLRNPNGSNPALGKLSVLSAIEDILEFDTHDPKTGRLTTLYTETFEEAVRVQRENLKKDKINL